MTNNTKKYRRLLRQLKVYCDYAHRVVQTHPELDLEPHFLRMVSLIAARATKRTRLEEPDVLADIDVFIARLGTPDRFAVAVADLYLEQTARGSLAKTVREALHGPLARAEQKIQDILDGLSVETPQEDLPPGLIKLAARNVLFPEKRLYRRQRLRQRLVAAGIDPGHLSRAAPEPVSNRKTPTESS